MQNHGDRRKLYGELIDRESPSMDSDRFAGAIDACLEMETVLNEFVDPEDINRHTIALVAMDSL